MMPLRYHPRTVGNSRLRSILNVSPFGRVGHRRLSPSSINLVLGTSPLRVAIVGSGPSGCYTAKYLLQATTAAASDKYPNTHIDIVERLPTAYGLVRNGVAPDHPEVKNVQHEFDTMMEKNKDRIRFYGNVEVGKDISLQELRERYDMVVLSYGCESDRSLNHLPGGGLKGILSAREFVAWYNGHVDFDWVGPIVQSSLASTQQQQQQQQQHIVVVGHGNVALDCARILAKTRDELNPTDLTTRALDVLHPPSSDAFLQKRTITVVGRRGHIQGAFTIKELRELTKLTNTEFVVRSDELEMGKTSASLEELNSNRPRTRMDILLTEAATKTQGGKEDRQLTLRFLLNPIRFEASKDDPRRLGGVMCERTQLMGEPGSQEAVGTGEKEILPAQLALVSIGYKGVAIQGTEAWFDESRGILKNTHGLVASASGELGGLYTAGWLKRGPSGIIGTNISDAKDTVATMLHDMHVVSAKSISSQTLDALLVTRGVDYVDWESYQRIDAAEMNALGKRHPDQPREKITIVDELLKATRL